MVTEEQLQGLKAKYGEVFEITVLDENGVEVKAYLKKPSRQILSAVMAKIGSDPIQANELLLNGCIIQEVSDMRIVTNDDLFMSAIGSLSELIQIRTSSIKKI